MLALAAWRDQLCPNCGQPLSECTDPAADDGYDVPPATRCHRSTAIAVAAERYRDSPHPSALLFRAVRRY